MKERVSKLTYPTLFCWAGSVELCWPTVSVVSFIFVKFREKNWIKMSCGYAYLHIMFFTTTKFQEILLRGFRGVALTNCVSSIFHFRQITKFNKSVIQRKKMESKFPVDMHIYTLCPSLLQSFTKFLLSSFRGVVLTNCFSGIFHFVQISKFKKVRNSQKKT